MSITRTELSFRTLEIISRAFKEGRLPGASIIIAKRKKILLKVNSGFAVLYKDPCSIHDRPIKVTTNTLYDLASLTKLFTSIAIAFMIKNGSISLDTKVSNILGWTQKHIEPIRIIHLLSHTSGLPAWIELFTSPTINSNPWHYILSCAKHPPGKSIEYSDMGFMLLGKILEVLTSKPLSELFKNLIFNPLGLNDTFFNPPFTMKHRIAATEWQSTPPRGLVHGQVHDENAYALGGIAGHAGLFSILDDVYKFCLYIQNDLHKSLKKEESHLAGIMELLSNQYQISLNINVKSLGFEKRKPFYMGTLSKLGAIGHTGFTGTSVVIEPSADLIVIILSNRIHPIKLNGKINDIRSNIADLALEVSLV